MVLKSDVDFGKTAKDYGLYRAGFPASFFHKISKLKLITPKIRVLDLGTGTGTVARGLSQMDAEVIGLDPSPSLIEEARELDRKAGVKIQYVTANAENTNMPSKSIDLVTAGQCWHWFNQEDALAEIRRVLRSGGRLMVCYFDWIYQPDNPVDEMYKLRLKYNPSWKSTWPLGFYPQMPKDLKFSGFESTHSFFYEEMVPYSHEGWRGRMRSYAGIGGSLPKATVEEFDLEFKEILKLKFPSEPMLVPHKIWAEIWRISEMPGKRKNYE